MARKVYYIDSKKKKVREDALLQLRQTRELIDPALLERARALIGQYAERQDNAKSKSVASSGPEKVPVDHKKNLMTVMKFLELKPGSRRLRRQIRALIAEGFE